MKRMKHIAIGTLLLLAVSGAAAQSLGDYARTIRKNKTTTSSPNRHYDNDNLPTGKAVSVVGPPSAGGANAGQAANASAPDPAAAATEERQKAADEWKEKLDQQKAKVDALNHELDLEQRELRLRAATTFTNPGAIVHDLQWEHDEAQHNSDAEAKQKALDAARQELDEMQEQARKAGIAAEDTDKDKDNENDKDKK